MSLSSAWAASYTVMVGAGKETTVVNAFIPENLKVHVGDTVNFKLSNDELYAVILPGKTPLMQIAPVVPIPGGKPEELMFNPAIGFPSRMPGAALETYDGNKMVGSGFMSKQPSAPGAPPNNTLSVKFGKVGSYKANPPSGFATPSCTAPGLEQTTMSRPAPAVQRVKTNKPRRCWALLPPKTFLVDKTCGRDGFCAIGKAALAPWPVEPHYWMGLECFLSNF